MARPDFVIIGSMKSGTSTLAAQLAEQPGIFMASIDELNFFSDDQNYNKGLTWYEALFDTALHSDIKGEVSTHYTKLPTYPEALPRLKMALPNARIIYIIRNPINRAISHYIHEWTMGVIQEDIAEAFEAHPELISYGCYARQIAPYIEAFGAENIFLTNLETMSTSPQDTLERVCQFLGVDEGIEWQPDLARQNESAQRIRRFKMHNIVFDNPVATALRRTLVPQAIRDHIKASRQMQKRPDLPASLRSDLEEVFSKDYADLCQMLPPAKHIKASYPFLS